MIKDKKLHYQIVANSELYDLEREGFIRGEKKGKTMNVAPFVIYQSLNKQIDDFKEAWYRFRLNRNDIKTIMELKRTIADLRNVSGCMFLLVQELTDK